MPETRPSPEAVVALLPYVEPDHFGEGTDRMRRENAARAAEAVEPLIRKEVLNEVREGLDREIEEYKRVGEGAPGDFDHHERAKAWGAVEHCHRVLLALRPDPPEQASERGTGKGGSPPKAFELSADQPKAQGGDGESGSPPETSEHDDLTVLSNAPMWDPHAFKAIAIFYVLGGITNLILAFDGFVYHHGYRPIYPGESNAAWPIWANVILGAASLPLAVYFWRLADRGERHG